MRDCGRLGFVFLVVSLSSCFGAPRQQSENEDPKTQTGSTQAPDDHEIAYFSPSDKSIYSLTGFNTKKKLVTVEDGTATWPVYSPDGNRIAFTGTVESVLATYTMDAKTGGDIRQITSPEGDLPEGVLDWHMDGRLVCVTKNKDHNAEIYLIKDKNDMVNITNHVHWDFFPLSHPDGVISFWTSRDDPKVDSKEYDYQSVYTVNPDGSDLKKRFQIDAMTSKDVSSGIFPAISPDGATYVFMMDQDLYRINMDGSDLTNVTNTKDNQELFPFFSDKEPKRVYFSSSEAGRPGLNIFSTDLNGKDRKQHTFLEGEVILYPKFRPCESNDTSGGAQRGLTILSEHD